MLQLITDGETTDKIVTEALGSLRDNPPATLLRMTNSIDKLADALTPQNL